jgi:hypothetical protein
LGCSRNPGGSPRRRRCNPALPFDDVDEVIARLRPRIGLRHVEVSLDVKAIWIKTD